MMAVRQGEIPVAPREGNTGYFAVITEPLSLPSRAELALAEFADQVKPWNPLALQSPDASTPIFDALAQGYPGSVQERVPTRHKLPSEWSRLTPELGRRLIEGLGALGTEEPAPVMTGVVVEAQPEPEPATRRWEPPADLRLLQRVLEGLRGLGEDGPGPGDSPHTEPTLPSAPAPLPPPAAVPPELARKVDRLLGEIKAARSEPETPDAPGATAPAAVVSAETPAGETEGQQESVVSKTDAMTVVVGAIGRLNEDLASLVVADGGHTPWWQTPEALEFTGYAPEQNPTDTAPDTQPAQQPQPPSLPEFLRPYAPPPERQAIEQGEVPRTPLAILPPVDRTQLGGTIFSDRPGTRSSREGVYAPRQTTGPIPTEGLQAARPESSKPARRMPSRVAAVGAVIVAGALVARRFGRRR